jgi:thiol:disulfide interchange protein DsbA
MKIFRILAIIALAVGLNPAHAEGFDEGIEYSVIKNPVATSDPDKVVVTEMFWYGCPHCFRFEPYFMKWKQRQPAGVVVEHIPSVLNPSWMEHARTYYALQVMGETQRTHDKIFAALHLKNMRLNNVDSMAEFVAGLGVDEKEFRSNYHSFPVDTMIRKSRKKERQYGHRGVPAVIINGKYLTSASMAGSNARWIQVIDYLVKKELQAKQ